MSILSESKNQLQADFILLKNMNAELIRGLAQWGEKNNTDRPFMESLTVFKCIDILKQVKEQALTDENYEAIAKTESQEILEEIAKNMDIQIRHHQEVKDKLDFYNSTN